MTSQQAREKLGRVVLGAPRSEWKQGVVDIMEAADVLMLAVHVEACEARSPMRSPYERDGHRRCGDRWHCEQAKAIKELGDGQG